MPENPARSGPPDTVLLRRRLFAAPPPRRLVAPIAGVSLLSAVSLTLPDFSWEGLVSALLVVALPIYGSAALTLPVTRALGGRTFLRRTTLLAFVDALVLFAYVALVSIAELVAYLTRGATFDYSRARLLLLAFGTTMWVRLAVWSATSDHRASRSAPAAAITPALGALAVAAAYPATVADLLLFLLLSGVFLASAIAFAHAVNAPVRHAFGANGMHLMRVLLDHITDPEGEAAQELEAFFDSFARPAEVRVGALALRAPQGTIALLVVPHAHPGPFGRVGGSDMPAKLRAALGDVGPVLVPHGPSTHDHNPATTAECLRLAAEVRDALAAADRIPGGSRFARVNVGPASATAQMFGAVALVTSSLAPNPTDDIDGPTGHAAIRAAKDAGARDALFVDAHNCMRVGSGTVRFGSEESLAVIEAAHRAVAAAIQRPAASLRAAFAEASLGSSEEGFGGQGVQVLVVDADGHRVAYLLFDGNNMVPGLREDLLEAVRQHVDEAEVLTTDNHSVNQSMGGYNPVGLRADHERIRSVTRALVARAVGELRPVESLAGSATVHGLRVFGHENTARLTSSINATVSVLRPTATLTLGLALAAALVLLLLVP